MEKDNYIVILSYYFFPCNHPVLENVFAKEMAQKLKIIFLFQGDVSQGKLRKWHSSTIYLTRGLKNHHWIYKIINKILGINIFLMLLKFLFLKNVKIVLLRDLPFKAFLLLPLRSIFKFKMFYQYSAPLGDIIIEHSKNYQFFKKIWFYVSGRNHNFITKIVLAYSDLVFTISNSHKNALKSKIRKEKLIPLTMGVDLDWIKRKETNKNTLKKFKKKHFVLIYFGSLHFVRNPKFIIKVFVEVKKRISNCKLYLIGKASNFKEEKELRIFCRQANLVNDVIFTGYLNRNKLQQYLWLSDISISAIPPKKCYKFSSPTKLYESLGNGVPVVANKGVYEQENLILESGGGILVDYNPKSFCKAIVKLLDNSSIRNEMGKKGKKYVIENYSYQRITNNIFKYFY